MSEGEEPRRETAVLGLGKSGVAASRLLLAKGVRVYASDAGSEPAIESAAAELRKLGARVDTGGHDLARIRRADTVVVSPGIPPSAAPIAAARESGVPLVSEIEIALRYLTDAKLIAVTGTNGKTTTTALAGHLLRGSGADAIDAGNIGTPLSEAAMAARPPEWIALEMSSFQLHDTPSLDPNVGVLTNLAPDHLDRYPTQNEYYADKARLFTNAADQSRWVLNADDERVVRMSDEVKGKKSYFSIHRRADAYHDQTTSVLHVLGQPLLRRDELQLIGDHNVANALAAALAVMLGDGKFRSDEARARMAAALRSFHALPHRLENVGEYGGVVWINDSKATNVSSTLVAVQGMMRPTILLLGGRHKGEPYTSLADAIRKHVKRVIAYGEAARLVEKDLAGVVPVDRIDGDFDLVMARAREAASPGDAVLLSPACSSYDMFNNYEERGRRFRELAKGTQ
jgi:UDP-N-acetylmuramoylalanine--D-glutamate ligase